MIRLSLFGLALAAMSPSPTHGAWPHWRGPSGDGHCPESALPQLWSPTDHVLWKVPLPGPGNSTPIVWQDRLFLTQAADHECLLICFSTQDGRELWRRSVPQKGEPLSHKTNPLCSSSPTTDGRHVVAWFGSAGLHAFTLDGQPSWSLDLDEQRHIWGYGASPVLHEGICYLNFGPGPRQFLIAVDLATGREIWRHDEPGGASGEGSSKAWIGSWSDPLIRQIGDHSELIHCFPRRVCAFDPATGRELWTCDGLNSLVYTSPLFEKGIAVGMGGYNGMALAVRTGGQGDVTSSHRLWQVTKTRQRIGSGVLHDGHIYILTDPGIAECRDLATGSLLWEERLSGPGPTSQNWSSLVLTADGLLYAINQGGDAFIFRASPDFELLATNSIGEKVIGSIAVSEGRLYLRSHQHLWCIGGK